MPGSVHVGQNVESMAVAAERRKWQMQELVLLSSFLLFVQCSGNLCCQKAD